MRKIAYILASAVAAIATTGCSDSFDAQNVAGEGRLLLRPSVNTDMKVSRAVDEEEEQSLNSSCIIWISNSNGLVRQYKGIENVPNDGIRLVGGNYKAWAWAGDSVPASFESRFFKGREDFVVSAGGTTQVNLECTIANTAVSVKYAEGVDKVLSDYTLTVGHSLGKLTWEGRDKRRGYFMMNSIDKDLAYTLSGKKQDGSEYTYEGTIEGVKQGTEYVLNVKYDGTEIETGGTFFTIEIDENTIDSEETVTIISAPSIIGVYQPLSQTVYGEAGKMGRQAIYVAAATELKSVCISAPDMGDIIGVNGGEFDIIRADESVLATLKEKGIGIFRQRDEENDLDNVKITFEPELLNLLGDGTYEINVTASVSVSEIYGENERVKVKSNSGKMTIVISDADVQSEPLLSNNPGIWATEATLTGKVMKDGIESAGFKYREKGTTDWIMVEGSVASRAALSKGTSFSATLTGLKPGTTYEYAAVAGDFTAAIYEFTTESATQLPNSGFEDWFKGTGNKDPYYVAASSDPNALFWDSGNHGSCTLGVNITSPDESVTHSGKYSIKMASQKVAMLGIGAFAAGNVFTGKFLGTENTTKGILGWGRPWATRPRALKGYIKYTPQAITEVGGTPAGVTINKGDMDAGIVYIAVVDESTMTYGSYDPWPQIVATKDINNYGFKPTASKVIAYGERVFTEATDGVSMVEFEIPLEYRRTDVKASNIIVVASASRYGDYYTGGPSVMYLDDLELVY